MKRIVLPIVLICLLFSCRKITKEQTKIPVSQKAGVPTTIKDSVVNVKNQVLHMEFDNEKHSAVMTFNNDRIELRQDTMGSGVQYSNSHYTYNEWHGQISLKKNDSVVFTNQ